MITRATVREPAVCLSWRDLLSPWPAGAPPEVPERRLPARSSMAHMRVRTRLVSGGGYQCGAPSYPETIAVRGGRFDYPYVVNSPRTVPMAVQVVADGTVHGQMQYGTEDYGPWRQDSFMTAWVTVTGRIVDTTLEATITDLRCVRHLTARRG